MSPSPTLVSTRAGQRVVPGPTPRAPHAADALDSPVRHGDRAGSAVSGGAPDPLALALPRDPADACRVALDQFLNGQGDPLAGVERVLHAHPGHVPAHCLRAAILVTSCSEDARRRLARVLGEAPLDRASPAQRRHLAAAGAWAQGEMKRAYRQYGDIAADDPLDALALRVAHVGDFQWGAEERLRDRVAAALPHWDERRHGLGQILAMHAFGLVESGDAAGAERAGRRALSLEPSSAGAVHAVAHVMEMQGRAADGIEWLRATAPVWHASPSYATHLWWHLALCHLDAVDTGSALRIHDARIAADDEADAPALVDATGLLWRLQLSGVDVGARWRTVADRWARRPLGGLRPFNDMHAVLAFAAAQRMRDARDATHALRERALRTPDLALLIDGTLLPACDALIAYAEGRHGVAASRLAALCGRSRRCGGSLAQGDLLGLTLIDAALRDRRAGMARSLVEARIAHRPASTLDRLLGARIDDGSVGSIAEAVGRRHESGRLPLAA
jgi:hypothetical protein